LRWRSIALRSRFAIHVKLDLGQQPPNFDLWALAVREISARRPSAIRGFQLPTSWPALIDTVPGQLQQVKWSVASLSPARSMMAPLTISTAAGRTRFLPSCATARSPRRGLCSSKKPGGAGTSTGESRAPATHAAWTRAEAHDLGSMGRGRQPSSVCGGMLLLQLPRPRWVLSSTWWTWISFTWRRGSTRISPSCLAIAMQRNVMTLQAGHSVPEDVNPDLEEAHADYAKKPG